MKKKATFNDIAKQAKVSPATVTRVAAGLHNVDPAIRQKVRDAAARLGVDLEKRKGDNAGRVIAYVLANRDVLHPFQARVLTGAEKYISEQGWELVFLTFRYDQNTPARELHLPQILSRRTPARGVILAGVNSHSLLEALRHRKVPFAVLGNNLLGGGDEQCDQASADDVSGGYDVTRHLIRQGHRAILFIGNRNFPWFARCGEGYRRAMAEAGLEPRWSEIQSDGRELGYLSTKSILSRKDRVTAIFAGSDGVAMGAYDALRESQIPVPGGISVAGFDDTEAANLWPALTSVRSFPEELGRHLAELTLKRIMNPLLPPQRIVLPTQLVVRDSTKAPGAVAEAGRA
ncbi:MAG: LacI family DNA-binding transcriptional regulator [Opitutaceae bacterium]|nr:LacI family DNA-binding transcriptional regulator [Opitutaceae bacterium]